MISLSTSKSGSNWLDRLRSSRGFPTGAEPDLDHFLASTSSTSSSDQPGPSTRSESTRSFQRVAGTTDVSDVLCDLFNMTAGGGGGECSRSFSKKHKSGRKQSNPKFFNYAACNLESTKVNDCVNIDNNGDELCSSDDLRREKSDNNAVVSSGDNSLNDKVIDDDEEDDIDLKAYTKSEITVIDTSFKEWKSDKFVFRKKDVDDDWKIKDKKSCFRGGRKRKLDVVNDEMGKNKVVEKHGNDKFMHLNQRQPQNTKERERREVKEPSQIVIGKVPHNNRFPCPKPPVKRKPEGSPVIVLKSIPLSNNTNVVTKLGKDINKKRPKKMKII